MASYSRTEIVIERVEYHVPAPAPWGANGVELGKAFRAAEVELRAAGNGYSDDMLSFSPGDGEIIISFELRRPKAVD